MAVTQSGMTLEEVGDKFEAVSGIEVNRHEIDSKDRLLIKVMDESVVGQYFRLTRTLPIEAWAQTRDCFGWTVMDSFVGLE